MRQKSIPNFPVTNNYLIDALFAILGYKSFAREGEYLLTGYTSEQWQRAKSELVGMNMINKAGAVKPNVKDFWYKETTKLVGYDRAAKLELLKQKYFNTELDNALT